MAVKARRLRRSRRDSIGVSASNSARDSRDTILVIDDDIAVRELMVRFLTKLGFYAVAAKSGKEGLWLARKVRPIAITLDVVMPEMDGWHVLNELKADPELAAIPVIMVTIVDNGPIGLDLGASGYMTKPVDRDRLASLLEKYRPTPPPMVGAGAR